MIILPGPARFVLLGLSLAFKSQRARCMPASMCSSIGPIAGARAATYHRESAGRAKNLSFALALFLAGSGAAVVQNYLRTRRQPSAGVRLISKDQVVRH